MDQCRKCSLPGFVFNNISKLVMSYIGLCKKFQGNINSFIKMSFH